ncbi:MAG: 30S ribosomal protein S6 [Candidatus Staskawiczbacteria bacterium]|nr:30S ribosomal protein S6 [Candidatus Staskawiczbacteria bacterium]
MKTYELTYIVSPDITSEEAEAKGKEIESLISSKEGTILKQSNPSARALAYPIEKRASGFFGVLEFQVEPEKLLELKETLLKDGKIVRHMLIIKEAAMMKKERRTRTKPAPIFDIDTEKKPEPEPAKPAEREKVELKDIEHELDEILG